MIIQNINDKWILKVPKQPIQGLGYHKNDSFRELPLLVSLKHKDVDVVFDNSTMHCWLEPNILLYDRPTVEWVNHEFQKASLLFLGNGDVQKEGSIIQQSYPHLKVKPWIFWPRRPIIVEKVLKEPLPSFDERSCDSIFIGNYENNVQEIYRTNTDWSTHLSEYHCTAGQKHIFTQEEYLHKLRNSKFGLCLRGYGSKCHREVECMALGTVPLITPEVSIDSYLDPPEEKKHYFKVNCPEDITEIIRTTDKDTWIRMSNACQLWFKKNVHSDNFWNNLISSMLYGK